MDATRRRREQAEVNPGPESELQATAFLAHAQPQLVRKKKEQKQVFYAPNLCPPSWGPCPSWRVLPTDRPTLVPPRPLKSHLEHHEPPTSSVRGKDGGPKSSDCCDPSACRTPHPAQTPPGSGRRPAQRRWWLRIRDLPEVQSRVRTARSPLCLGPGPSQRPHRPAVCSQRLPLVGGGRYTCVKGHHTELPLAPSPWLQAPEFRRTSTTRLRGAPGKTHRRRCQSLDNRGQRAEQNEASCPGPTHLGPRRGCVAGPGLPTLPAERGPTLPAPCRGGGRHGPLLHTRPPPKPLPE